MQNHLSENILEGVGLLSELTNEYVWFVQLSADNVLRLDFGAPHLEIRGPAPHAPGRSQAVADALERRMVVPTGKWHLFIEDGEWSVSVKHYLASRASSEGDIRRAINQLDGQKLVKADYDYSLRCWILTFDLNGVLKISSSLPEDASWSEESQWTLFYENGTYISFLNNGKLIEDHRLSR